MHVLAHSTHPVPVGRESRLLLLTPQATNITVQHKEMIIIYEHRYDAIESFGRRVKKSSQQDFCDSTHRQARLRTLAQYVKLNNLYVYIHSPL